MKIIGTLFLTAILAAWLGLLPQGTPPALPHPGPVALTELERTRQENLMLRLQILQRDEKEFVDTAMRAHGLDPEKYRFDSQNMMFIPVAPLPTVEPAPAQSPTLKQK